MQLPQLTALELGFIADMVIAYRARRIKAIAKTVRKSPSFELETLSLTSLVTKLSYLHTHAAKELETVEEINDLVEELDNKPFAHHHYQAQITE